MNPFTGEQWLQIPPDRDVIHRWTKPDNGSAYRLFWPGAESTGNFTFAALGDTGDSEGMPPGNSPQDGVAKFLYNSCSESAGDKQAKFVVHLGDVVYMTGEHRLYERNFRVPYSGFLTEDSTSTNLTFKVPFLPVPGNHDYYDLGIWTKILSRVPILGSGLRALSRELFSFNVPRGGSDMGASYMDAFVAKTIPDTADPFAYQPGTATKLPNRYYKYSVGKADFFALDSNTLDAPGSKPSTARTEAAKAHASLQIRSKQLQEQLAIERKAMDDWRSEYRNRLSESDEKLQKVVEISDRVANCLAEICESIKTDLKLLQAPAISIEANTIRAHWDRVSARLHKHIDDKKVKRALDDQDPVSDNICDLLEDIDQFFSGMETADIPTNLRNSQRACEAALHEWALLASPTPPELGDRLKQLSEEALDVQRELADEQRRMHYLPEDHDTAQLSWLDNALNDSERDNPDGWRIVILHHPLYTTIGNHCEKPDVLSVRENLQSTLGQRVHLVLSGHSHAFEWFKSDLLPNTGIIVSGGGGQITLRRSVLDPKRIDRNRDRYTALRNAGVTELAAASKGPDAPDGASGYLYHFITVDVSEETLTVKPTGVRWVNNEFRSEAPMPVYHVPRLPIGTPEWNSRLLVGIEIRRDTPPKPLWNDQ